MKPSLLSFTKLKWVRFVLGGGINTTFTYTLYVVLSLMINYQAAYLIAYILGVLFAYWFNAVIVFHVPPTWKKFFSYPLVYVVQYAVSVLLLTLFVEILQINQYLAPLLVVAGTIPITFMMNKWVLERPNIFQKLLRYKKCQNKIMQ